MNDDNLDPGIPVLRMILVVAWGAICFGAGTLYAPERKFAACTEIPKRVQNYPVTRAEKAAWIQRYSNGGM